MSEMGPFALLASAQNGGWNRCSPSADARPSEGSAYTLLTALTRARGDRPARAAWSAQRLLVDVVIFVLAELLLADSGSGPTMELRRSMLTLASPARSGDDGVGADRAKAR